MLTVVGTVALDTLARVKSLPATEETGGIVHLQPDTPGGTAGNVAMALARLGARSRILSAVGLDFAASGYAAQLMALGIDITGLEVTASPTSRAYVFFDETNRQVTYFYPGASSEFTGSALHAGGRGHFCAGELSAYPRLMKECEWVSFDPGQELFHRDVRDFEACLPHADVLFANRHERDRLEELGWGLSRLLGAGLDAVIETRGGEGTLVHTPAGRFAAPAIPVRALDPTGAGDAHRAGFLYALQRGADLAGAARFANTMGSFAVEHVGAQAGHPTLAAAIERHAKAYGERPF